MALPFGKLICVLLFLPSFSFECVCIKCLSIRAHSSTLQKKLSFKSRFLIHSQLSQSETESLTELTVRINVWIN